MITYIITNELGAIVGKGNAVSKAEAKAEAANYGTVLCGTKYEAADIDTHYVKDGELKAFPESPSQFFEFDYETEEWVNEDVAAAKEAALRRVAAEVDRIRRAYLTPLTGQDLIYVQKQQEAATFQADPAPDLVNYPFINAEIGQTGSDAAAVAAVFMARAQAWASVGSALEKARLTAASEMGTAATVAEIDVARAIFMQQIEGMT